MKKKNKKLQIDNQLSQLGFGGMLTPQLFDLAANTLTNLTTYAVTDMIKAIREPEQEIRPTKMNTGFTMANGGTVGDKPKYVKVNGKRMKVDSPEYREYYQQVMSDRERGIYYNSPIDAEVVVTGKKMTKAEKKKAQEERYKMLEAGFQAGLFDGLDNQGNYVPFEGGRPGIDGALNNAVLDYINMGRKDYVDGPLENMLEYIPLLGSFLSTDDYTLAKEDLQGENKEGIFNNAIDMAGILPIGKYGNVLKIPKYIETAADVLGLYGTAKDLYQDNISPMLSPNQNYPKIPKGYDMNQKLFDYQKNQPGNINIATDEEKFAMGGMIKRADGSYSKRGLWDNIRANKGSGKKPTKQMLEQERKIKAQMAMGGVVTDLNEYGTGGTIHIKPSKRGTFTAAAKKHGKSVQAFASQVLANKDNYSPAMVKKANFARNASKWKHAFGGMITPDMYMQQMMYGSYANGGEINEPCPPGFVKDPRTGECIQKEMIAYNDSTSLYNQSIKNIKDKYGFDESMNNRLLDTYTSMKINQFPINEAITKNIKAVDDYKKSQYVDDNYYVPYLNNLNTLYNSLNKNILPSAYFQHEDKIPFPMFKKPTKPAVRVPEMSVEETAKMMDDFEKNRKQKGLETIAQKALQDINPGKPNQEPNYYSSMKMTKYSPEDVLSLYKLKGYGLEHPNMQYLDLDYDLNEKLRRQKLGEKFTPMNIMVEGYQFTPSPEELDKMNQDSNYKKEWANEQMEGRYGKDWRKKLGKKSNYQASFRSQSPYSKYANGGQVPQNIPVEVEGEEMYEMPNGQVGEFEGPSHEQGGIIPTTNGEIGLPEGTEVFSKRLKVDGKSMADRKKIRENNVAKLEKLLNKNPSDKFIREALKRQKETAELEEQSDMAIQQQANQKQQMQEQAQQGMMQEQAMAGLMQDPAMMQQMGMMMYGGKLANGTPPYGLTNPFIPTYTAPQVNNLQMTDANYLQKFDEALMKNNLNITSPDNIVRDNVGFIPELQTYDYNNLITNKPNVTDTNPPFFTEDQLNMLTNPQVNPLDIREKKGGVDVKSIPEMNPITTENLANPFTSVYTAPQTGAYPTIKEPATSGQLPTYPLAMGVDPMSDIVQQAIMKGMPDPMAGKYPLKKGNKFMNFLNKAANETGDFFTGLFDKKGKPKKEGDKKGETKSTGELPFTAGDYMGMAGTLFGGLAPMTTTMLNRMMTPKNQNFFREFGAEGLRAMQEAQALSAINRDKQLADIKLGEEASRQRGRNTARGVNTLRAMDISSDIAANQAQNQAYNAYAQQMMQMLGQKAQMENMQDQMVMQGEYQRDLADRQDVDQFYTNLAQNFASQSELMQKQGRDMNQAQYNKMILEMSPMFSKYGIGVEMRNGKVVFVKDGETIDETTARLEVKKGLEKEKTTGTTSTTSTSPTNPLGLGHTPYFNPIFTDINIPTVTDKSLTKAATKRRK